MSDYPPQYLPQILEILLVAGRSRNKNAYEPLMKAAGVSRATAYSWTQALVREMAKERRAREQAAPSPDPTSDDEDREQSSEPVEPEPSSIRTSFEVLQAAVRGSQLETDIEESLRIGDTEKAFELLEELRALAPGRASMFEMRMRLIR